MASNGSSSLSQIDERFNAAVNVIRSLPKNGSYQPSNDMLLKFYAYFKQATLGPCTLKKPPFWEIVNKAKWDAYKALGNMSPDRAKELYVEELKKIIETMSYTENVAEFMGSISELNGIDLGDLEAIAPDAIKKVKSHPNSPFASRESSPIRAPQINQNDSTNFNEIVNNVISNGNNNHIDEEPYTNGYNVTEYSDDEYIDTVEDDSGLSNEQFMQQLRCSRSNTRRMDYMREDSTLNNNKEQIAVSNTVQVALNQMLRTVECMQTDLHQINNRISVVERAINDLKVQQQLRTNNKKITELKYPKWWPFTEISPNWFILLIVWPFVARRLLGIMERKRS